MATRKRRVLTRAERNLRSDGALCLTFVNTATVRRKSLATYGDLVAWAVETDILAAAEASRLEAAAAEHPGQATGAARRAQTLSGRLRRMVLAAAGGGKPTGADAEALNAELHAAFAARRLAFPAGRGQWSWGAADDDFDRVLWPVLISAAELLASDDVRRVRQCPGEDCGVLFLSRGGGKQRKWCSAACLNRATSREHYRRHVKPARLEMARNRERRRR